MTRLVLAMAFSRDNWINTARNRLVGSLREYAKEQMAPLVPLNYTWEKEIRQLIRKLTELFDPKITKLKTKFDLKKAFVEAVNEAGGEQIKILEAKDIYLDKYLKDKTSKEILDFEKKVSQLNLDARNLILDMLEKYAPELLEFLKN